MNEFCVRLAEVLDISEVKESDILSEFPEWDSLSVLSVLAMLDSKYNVNLPSTDLKGVRTVADLWKLVQSCAKQ